MKVLTKNQTILAESKAIKKGLSALRLMENAGSAAAKEIGEQTGLITILTGSGNNGGDGFVVARKLKLNNHKVAVVTVTGNPVTDAAKESFKLFKEAGGVWYDLFSQKEKCKALILNSDVIVDAILGTGTRGAITELVLEAVNLANESKAYKVALDIPTGLTCDSGEVLGQVFKADKTISFIGYKPCHVTLPAALYCGNTTAVSIGIDKEDIIGDIDIIDPKPIKQKTICDNKYTAGVLGVDAGEHLSMGAAYYLIKAASLMGTGLIKVKYKEKIYNNLSSLCPYAVFKENKDYTNKASALAIGSGCINGCDLSVLEKGINTVIDADGIKELKEHIDLLECYGNNIILTPHSGEMARFLGITVKELEENRIHYATEVAKNYNTTVVLKGAFTIVATPQKTFINTTSNPVLATAASGDILTGIIGGLLALGYNTQDAATTGVYIHGLMGVKAQEKYGMAVNADCLIDVLPLALNNL